MRWNTDKNYAQSNEVTFARLVSAILQTYKKKMLVFAAVDLSQIAAGDRWLPHARNREPHNNNTNYVLPPANYNQLSLESLLMGAGVVQQDHVVVWLSDDRLVMSDMLGNFLVCFNKSTFSTYLGTNKWSVESFKVPISVDCTICKGDRHQQQRSYDLWCI